MACNCKSDATQNRDTTGTKSHEDAVSTDIYAPLTLRDVVDLAHHARNTATQLPCDKEIKNACDNKEASKLIREGASLVRFIASEGGDPDPDDLHLAYIRFMQIDTSLTIVGQQMAQSCIGTAESEKQKCKKDCKGSGKKLCGCVWNSFLTKTNCFIGGIDPLGPIS